MSSPNKGKKTSATTSNPSPKHFRWTQDMENMFIELLLHEQSIGNRIGGTFTPTAYRNIITELNAWFGTSIQKNHVRNKIKTLKSHYSVFKDAFGSMSGFAWNWETMKFEADDSVWEALIKEKPSAAGLRDKTLINGDKLQQLFATSRATGVAEFTARDVRTNLYQRIHLDSNSSHFHARTPQCHTSSVNLGDASGNQNYINQFEDPGTPTTPSTEKTEGYGKGKRKLKDRICTSLDVACEKMLLGIESLSRAILESAKQLSKVDMTRNVEIFEILQGLQLPKQYMMRAYKYLGENSVAAGMFLSLPPEFRKDMLICNLGVEGSSP